MNAFVRTRVRPLQSCIFGIILVACTSCAVDKAPIGQCCPAATADDTAAVVSTVQEYYAALQVGDAIAVRELTAPGFYAYDGGARYSGDELEQLIARALQKGTRYEWTLTGFDVHVACNQAWLAYRNGGGIRDAGVFTPLTWLESAALTRIDGHWHMRFLHATRVKGS